MLDEKKRRKGTGQDGLAKDVVNSAAMVLTFTPLPPLAPALMAGSAAISVVQGNYLEAGITVLCTLPMLKAPGVAAAENEASQSLGNLARRGESVAAEDAGLGLGKNAAGEVTAKCGSEGYCFVAGTPVLVPGDADGAALTITKTTEDEAAHDWRLVSLVVFAGAFGWYIDEKRTARRSRKATVAKPAPRSSGKEDEDIPAIGDDETEPEIGPVGGDVRCEVYWQTPSLRGIGGFGRLSDSGEWAGGLALMEKPKMVVISPKSESEEANAPTDSRPARHLHLGRWWFAACLILAGFLAVGGTGHRTATSSFQEVAPAAALTAPANRPIESIHVGQRVVAQAQGGAPTDKDSETSVDPKTWRWLRLHAENRWDDGTLDTIEVETLQSPEWIKAEKAAVGRVVRFPLELLEMGLPESLRATVMADQPCPPIAAGPGRIVLTTVNHLNSDVLELTLADAHGRQEAVRPTGAHRFYSADRNDWVAAGSLRQGERLQGVDGALTVVGSARFPGAHRVYNMTVEGDHVYHVSLLGALVHNTYSGSSIAYIEEGHHAIPQYLGGFKKQVLVDVERGVHDEFHSVLAEELAERGLGAKVVGDGGSATAYMKYFRKNPGTQAEAFEAVAEVSAAIDKEYGTNLLEAFWYNITAGNFTPFK